MAEVLAPPAPYQIGPVIELQGFFDWIGQELDLPEERWWNGGEQFRRDYFLDDSTSTFDHGSNGTYTSIWLEPYDIANWDEDNACFVDEPNCIQDRFLKLLKETYDTDVLYIHWYW